MIERNKHPAGRLSNMVFGCAAVCDGLVRVVSLGFLHTRLTLNWSRRQAKRAIRKPKK